MPKLVERRQKILETLKIYKHETIKNLSFKFGVSRITILRDIAELSIDYPIYTVSGRYGGGIYILDDKVVGRQKIMSDKQIELLLKLLPTLNSADAEIMKNIINSFTVLKNGEGVKNNEG